MLMMLMLRSVLHVSDKVNKHFYELVSHLQIICSQNGTTLRENPLNHKNNGLR